MLIHVANRKVHDLYPKEELKRGDPRALDVDPADTIGSLKARIQVEFSISNEDMEQCMLINDPRYRLPLTLLDDARDLLDASSSTTLAECSVKDGDTLRLGWKGPFFIRVESALGLRNTMEVRCSDKICEFIEKVELITAENVAEDNFPQLLLSADKDRTLLSFGIFKMAPHPPHGLPQYSLFRNRDNMVFPYPRPFSPTTPPREESVHASKIQIGIEFPNMPWRFSQMFEPTDTIDTVRRVIKKKCYSYELFGQAYIEKGLYVLFSGNKPLKDNSLSLYQCGITHTSTIQVFEDALLSIVIYIRGKPFELPYCIKCFETVGILKEMFQLMFDIPADKQHLIYKDWHLDDKKKRLEYYSIAEPVTYEEVTIKAPQNSRFMDRPPEEFRIRLDESEPVAMACVPKIIETTVNDEFPEGLLVVDYHCVDSARRIIHTKYSEESGPARFGEIVEGLYFFEGFRSLPPAILPNVDHSSATKLQITIEIPNMRGRFPLDFNPTDTINTLRKRVIGKSYEKCELFDHSFINAGMFVLFFDKEQLVDDSATLDSKGIGHMDCIELFEDASFNIEIFVPEHRPLHIRVEVRSFETIAVLKEKVEVVTGIHKDRQHLQYHEWFLDDKEMRLVDYGILKKVKNDGSRRFREKTRIVVASSKKGLEKALHSF